MRTLTADRTIAIEIAGLKRIEQLMACLVLLASIWTLLVHLSVVLGLSYIRLFHLFPWLAAGCIALFFWIFSGRHSLVVPIPTYRRITWWWAWCLAAIAAVAVYVFSHSWSIFLGCAAVILFVGVAALRRPNSTLISPQASPPKNSRWQLLILLLLCLVGAGATALVHRPDIDDAFYVSAAVNAVHHPRQVVWSTDSVFGRPGLPVMLPVYKVESYELFVAFAARTLHLSSLRVAHTVMPSIFAVLVILSWALLSADLDRDRWLAITAIAIAVAFLAGATHVSPGNFTFFRMQQGKTVLAAAGVPLMYHFGRQFLIRGLWQDWMLWMAGGIACMGLSSTGIVVVPITVGVIILGEIVATGRLSMRLLAACCVIIYPLAIGAFLRQRMQAMPWISQTPPVPPATIIDQVFGTGQAAFFLFALLFGWALLRDRRSAAVLWASAVVLLLVLLDPFCGAQSTERLFSTLTYWRVVWTVPLIVLGASAVIALAGAVYHQVEPLFSTTAARCAAGCAVLAMLASLGWHPIWRTDDDIHFGIHTLDVDPAEYAVAQRAAALTPHGSTALAPEIVASWMATLDHRPQLVFTRVAYALLLEKSFGADEASLRNQLGVLAAQPNLSAADIAVFDSAIPRFSIGTVVLVSTTYPAVSTMLHGKGFIAQEMAGYSIWHK